MRGCGAGPGALAPAVARQSRLEVLDLAGNAVGDGLHGLVGEAPAGSGGLVWEAGAEYVAYRMPAAGAPLACLSMLGLADNGLGPEHLAALLGVVAMAGRLDQLDLGDNQLDGDCAGWLLHVLLLMHRAGRGRASSSEEDAPDLAASTSDARRQRQACGAGPAPSPAALALSIKLNVRGGSCRTASSQQREAGPVLPLHHVLPLLYADSLRALHLSGWRCEPEPFRHLCRALSRAYSLEALELDVGACEDWSSLSRLLQTGEHDGLEEEAGPDDQPWGSDQRGRLLAADIRMGPGAHARQAEQGLPQDGREPLCDAAEALPRLQSLRLSARCRLAAESKCKRPAGRHSRASRQSAAGGLSAAGERMPLPLAPGAHHDALAGFLSALSLFVTSSSRLRHLDLSKCAIGDAGAACLAQSLTGSACSRPLGLRSLALAHNCLGPSGASALSGGLTNLQVRSDKQAGSWLLAAPVCRRCACMLCGRPSRPRQLEHCALTWCSGCVGRAGTGAAVCA